MKHAARMILVTLVSAAFALGQAAETKQTVSPEMRAAANEAYQTKDWATAAARYEKIVQLEDTNAGAHYRLGVVLLQLKRDGEALQHLESAMSISPNAVFALAAARAQARAGKTDKVYEVLEKSLTLGGIAPEALMAENDFAAIKNESRFADIVRRSDLAVNPCKAKPEFRQFDFWIGEWDARNAQGVTVGSSSIQLILGNCIIFENWSTPLSSGKSFNVFDTRDGKWHQTWVDDKGLMTHYVGGLVDGKMVLTSESVANGKKNLARMTFSRLENGDVRQLGENSADDGKTWAVTFDFTYVRKK